VEVEQSADAAIDESSRVDGRYRASFFTFPHRWLTLPAFVYSYKMVAAIRKLLNENMKELVDGECKKNE
jgi:hypothetical protein